IPRRRVNLNQNTRQGFVLENERPISVFLDEAEGAMSISVKKPAGLKSIDPVWDAVRAGAEQIVAGEPSLANMVISSILNHDSLGRALAYSVSARLHHDDVSADLIRQVFTETLSDAPEIGGHARADLAATLERDPACHRAIEPLLYFKGYQAIQTHR